MIALYSPVMFPPSNGTRPKTKQYKVTPMAQISTALPWNFPMLALKGKKKREIRNGRVTKEEKKIVFTGANFWWGECGASLAVLQPVLAFKDVGNPKISQLDIVICVQQNVFWLDITMNNFLEMHYKEKKSSKAKNKRQEKQRRATVFYRKDQLPEVTQGLRVGKVRNLLPCCHFHDGSLFTQIKNCKEKNQGRGENMRERGEQQSGDSK